MLAEEATVPIAIHLDHATTDEDIELALTFAEQGVAFDSIMVRPVAPGASSSTLILSYTPRARRSTRATPTRTTRTLRSCVLLLLCFPSSSPALTRLCPRAPPQSKKHITRATGLGIACEVELGRLGEFRCRMLVLNQSSDSTPSCWFLQREERPACASSPTAS